MNNGPKVWNRLLNSCPDNSLVMGGAVIDWWLGHKPNDIDIFYPYKHGGGPFAITPPGWVLSDADFNDPVWVAEHDAQYMQGVDKNGDHPICVVTEYIVDGDLKVQMIAVNYKNAAEHFKNFDHTLTLGRYSKNGLFIHRKVFETMATHVVQYVSKDRSALSIVRSLERAKKKTTKYSGGHEGDWDFEGFTIQQPKKNAFLQGIFGG